MHPGRRSPMAIASPRRQSRSSDRDSDSSAGSPGGENSPGPGLRRGRTSPHSLYKTEMCRSFSETGSCRYGAKCQFAHGSSDLRPVARHPKYKTEVCRSFACYGTCPYGTRCRFIHHTVQGDQESAAAAAPAAAGAGNSPPRLGDGVSTVARAVMSASALPPSPPPHPCFPPPSTLGGPPPPPMPASSAARSRLPIFRQMSAVERAHPSQECAPPSRQGMSHFGFDGARPFNGREGHAHSF